MAHWPKTVPGNLLLLELALTPIVVWVAVSLSSPLTWASLAVVGLTGILLYVWLHRRRVEVARERAWIGSFSFAEVNARRRARDAGQVPQHSA